MADELNGRRIAFLVANSGVEQVELTTPWEAVEKAGGQPVLVAPEQGKVQPSTPTSSRPTRSRRPRRSAR
jgi:protease I